jgi:NAD(P)-dependent dehydrogenase (short-subunit alcohol dehydrogenase family)
MWVSSMATVAFNHRADFLFFEKSIDTFSTNIDAYFFVAKRALPHLKSGDTIINTTSVTAYAGTGPVMDYITTKGAIVEFTRALSNEQVSKGIRVNAVAPGPAWAPLMVSTMDKESLSNLGATPMGRPVSRAKLLLDMYT